MATIIRSASEGTSNSVQMTQEDLPSEEENCFLARVWSSFIKAMNFLIVSIGNLCCCRSAAPKPILPEPEPLTPQSVPKSSDFSASGPLVMQTPLESENAELMKEINGISSRILLPQPVEDLSVIQDISRLTAQQTVDILVQPEKAPSPSHLQEIRYLNVMGYSQKTNVNQIFASVFLGNYDALRSVDASKGNNPNKFTRVISVTTQDPNTTDEFVRVSIPEHIARMVMKVHDEEAAWIELETHFERLFQFIDDARIAKENILIHCTQGQSRSATVLLAYIMNRFHVSLQDALTFVKTRRFLVEPIPALLARLSQYEKSLKHPL